MFILVVEDDPDLSQVLAEILSSFGHQVERAHDGADALDCLIRADERPALILSDLAMPIMDGWSFLNELRKNSELARIPVVIMTASSEVGEQARASGARAVLYKPVDVQKLERLINHFVKAA
ncbi:MAG TPA: response regulator [Candidatus Binataceae bacterium]|nr:response regulator [Candidatus Binataceae bacterium]